MAQEQQLVEWHAVEIPLRNTSRCYARQVCNCRPVVVVFLNEHRKTRAMILTDLGTDLLKHIMNMVIQMRIASHAQLQAVWRGVNQRRQASASLVRRRVADASTRRPNDRQDMDYALKTEGVRPFVPPLVHYAMADRWDIMRRSQHYTQAMRDKLGLLPSMRRVTPRNASDF